MGDYGADEFPALNKMRTVAFNWNLFDLPQVKVDQFPTDDADLCFSFVQKLGKQRLLVRVDPDQIPG